MRKLFFTLLLVVATAASAQEELKHVYDETLNPLEQIENAVAQAHRDGKFVLCQVGGNWCPWCLRFAHFVASDTTLSQVVQDNFVYVPVSYNPRKADNPELAKAVMQRLGNPARFGFPVFVVLDDEGRILHTQDSSYLEEGKGYNRERVLRFFQNWTPTAVRANP